MKSIACNIVKRHPTNIILVVLTVFRTSASNSSRLTCSRIFLLSDDLDESQRCLAFWFEGSMVIWHSSKTSILRATGSETPKEQAHLALPNTKSRILGMFLSAKSFRAGSNRSDLSTIDSPLVVDVSMDDRSVDGLTKAICASIAKQNAFVSWLSLSNRKTICMSCPCRRERLLEDKLSKKQAPTPDTIR